MPILEVFIVDVRRHCPRAAAGEEVGGEPWKIRPAERSKVPMYARVHICICIYVYMSIYIYVYFFTIIPVYVYLWLVVC